MGLKVGLLNDSFPPAIDGVANAVKAYAEVLHKNGDTPIVITPKYPHVNDNYDYKVYRYNSMPTDKLIGYRAGNPFSPISIKDICDENIDILHVHCPFASAVVAREIRKLTTGRRIPIVFTYHTKFDIDIETRVRFTGFQKIAINFILANIKSMDKIWAVTQGAGESLQNLGYNGDFTVMPNGTDFKRGKASAEEIAAIEKEYNIESGVPLLIFVGRMFWYKNVGLSIEALKMLADDGINFRMILAGEGDDRHAMEEFVNEIGLSDRITFVGAIYNREKLRALYSRADLFMFPSTYDTSGLVVKEAAACDCPSVIVAGSCAGEGITDRVSGYLCDETPESIYRTVKEAVSDMDKLSQIGRNAGEMVYYSWDDAVMDARAEYEKIIAESSSTKKHFFK